MKSWFTLITINTSTHIISIYIYIIHGYMIIGTLYGKCPPFKPDATALDQFYVLGSLKGFHTHPLVQQEAGCVLVAWVAGVIDKRSRKPSVKRVDGCGWLSFLLFVIM